jgi:hypothetical protein
VDSGEAIYRCSCGAPYLPTSPDRRPRLALDTIPGSVTGKRRLTLESELDPDRGHVNVVGVFELELLVFAPMS